MSGVGTFGVTLNGDVMEQIFPLMEFLSQPESKYRRLRFRVVKDQNILRIYNA